MHPLKKQAKHWQDIRYLSSGTPQQQAAYETITSLKLLQVLERYDPILVGTIPIDIDILTSDLDIICHVPDAKSFIALLNRQFLAYPDFSVHQTTHQEYPSVIARFQAGTFAIEIFGQDLPTWQQNAFVHMVIEHRLLEIGGDKAKVAIRNLKLAGIKTEPAFVEYFGLGGDDPYKRLLDLVELDDDALRQIITQS